MNFRKKFGSFISLLLLALIISGCGLLSYIGFGEEEKPAAEKKVTVKPGRIPKDEQFEKEFFLVKRDVASIRSELARIKSEIENFKAQQRRSPAEEAYLFAEAPEITHAVTLTNGTVVLGKIVRETLDEVVITTQLGTLNIARRYIKDIKEAERPSANPVISGKLREENYVDRKVFLGTIKNDGNRRADFVQIKFKLHDESTAVIAEDSTYVDGSTHMFKSGVITDTTIDPGKSAPFKCTIYIPEGKSMTYYTYEIIWKEYE